MYRQRHISEYTFGSIGFGDEYTFGSIGFGELVAKLHGQKVDAYIFIYVYL